MTPPVLSHFDEYKLLILDKLDALDRRVERLDEKLDHARIDITMLKVKAGLIGAGAGLVAGALIGKFIH
jgi:hypothetical protein